MDNAEYLRSLDIRSEKALLLRDHLVKLTAAGERLPTKSGRPNVEILSQQLGISRQNFYSGRVSIEFSNLLEWAVKNLPHNELKPNSKNFIPRGKPTQQDKLNIELIRLKNENIKLQAELKLLRKINLLRHQGIELIV